ncbi:MAG: glycosyltransferase family 4 protein [Roseicyclus sp.]|uniref:glycosyltransferase family 4 protein n=1 Tax=Roseicyclus sp. TaxID=1914329 RepID=UPI003A84C74A
MDHPDLSTIDVLAPNFKKRLSGVTATVVRLVPLQARDIAIAAVAPALPPHVPQVPMRALLTMSREGPSGARVWHARRNSEMLAGILLKRVLGKRLKLLFTSASQRRHTRYSKWLIGQMDHVISTSRRTAEYLERPSDVILHGIDLSGFTPAEDRAGLRARMGLPAGPLIGCFGRIRAQKGTGDFVKAMIEVLPEFPGACAIVMGRATEKHRAYERGLREQVLAAGLEDRILFKPEVPVHEIADWYRALDLFVAPQRWEGFGLTPLEAMACGVPVVATRVGAFEELVVPGRTGALIAPQDVGAMAGAVRGYLENPAEMLLQGEDARAHAVAQFDIAGEAAAITAIYRKLLAG